MKKNSGLINATLAFVFLSFLCVGSNSQSKATEAPGIFLCETIDGVPTTVVNHPRRGSVKFITWASDYFSGSGWIPQKRCDIVSKRFQQNKKNGTLKFIVSGIHNGQKAVCASKKLIAFDKNCNEERLLFTINPSRSTANDAIRKMYALNIDANVDPLNESDAGLYEMGNYVVLDVTKFLENVESIK
jgi:Circadian oscillating protein COP23